ncbi:hypothetical protein CEK28_14425 [Xenophilus sp. AP218F]|nr:hypothetical protein CEK28_14425 [Xenophilus sp. AP218F]
MEACINPSLQPVESARGLWGDVDALIIACGYLQHSAMLFAADANAELAMIRSGFCPSHLVEVDVYGGLHAAQEVHQRANALLQSHALRFAMHEMLMHFGPQLCNDGLANLVVQGVRSLHDWQLACQSMADLGRGPARAAA